MPETITRQRDIFRQIVREYWGGNFPDVNNGERARKITNMYISPEKEMIGAGNYHAVIGNSENPDKVYACRYRSTDAPYAKKLYYAHRMLETLFPHNFPHIYASGMQNTPYTETVNWGWNIRRRVEDSFLMGEIKYPLSHVREELGKMELSVGIDDGVRGNIIVGRDGGEYYVDLISWPRVIPDSENKIVEYMTKQMCPEAAIKQVKSAIDRIRVLNQERTVFEEYT